MEPVRPGLAVKVAISADHAGLPLRARVAEAVTDAGHEPVLLGPDTAPPEGIDYPVIAKLVGDCLAAAEAERGILVCGSGAGVTIAANRLPGVRAAYGSDHYTAHQMVEHDHVNVLTLGSRVMGSEVAAEVVAAFVGATPSTEARHLRRLGEVLEFERERSVNAAVELHHVGQSLWLDNITRDLLASGTLARYIGGLAVTGLTSNPTIFDKAVTGSADYDDQIRLLAPQGLDAESLFFELAITDLTKAASLFRPIWDATEGVDGWVSLEVSPKLAYDTASTTQAAKTLHGKAATPNLFIKIPGTPAGIPAIEEAIFAGVPVNVTLLFSREHYLAAAGAYLRGLERRLAVGLDLGVGSVASVFISRWDVAVAGAVPDGLRGNLLASPSPGGPTTPTATCWFPTGGRPWPPPAPSRSGCCGPAPASRTRPCRTRSTSPRWPRSRRSTPCRRTPSWPSGPTARWATSCRPTAATPKRSCWSLPPAGSTSTPSPPDSSPRAPSRS